MRNMRTPTGLVYLRSVIDLLRDPKEIEKAMDEIDAAMDKVNEQIALAGGIDEIQRLRAEAAAALEAAEKTQADAEKQADVILGKAGNDAANEKARQDHADEIFRNSKAREAELNSRASEIAAGEKALDKRRARMDDFRADLSSLLD